ncbi:LuxR family transcriptional regulator [Stutzerimonas stutzeri]|uniref:LuxR family transcriptional regulator n=1 Tax=Stutzerimonas stutzeri TaxID=316 RepID=W8R071_STUST|nr:helix-turn-helix transcriptional regulator [Stutzerimonas stutzeri]AHL76285.1 LuxR family transcriptional regulator [Stutzerimonas stutzeri]MCQ4329514.1 helix-turn-helix transcriptional regulator [Stutzerimonas stutzeri]
MKAEDAITVSTLINAVNTDGLGAAIDSALAPLIDYDMSCAYLFRATTPAVLIHNGYRHSVPESTLNAYLRGGYLLDPFYVACMNDHPAGLWRMSDLAPDSFFSSGYSISKDIHPCVSSHHGTSIEEIGFIIPIRPQVAAVYSLMKGLENGGFQDDEMDAIAHLAPILNALFELQYRPGQGEPQASAAPSSPGEDAFIQMLQGQLTEAQSHIAKLILQGHSNASIADKLNISEGTVKVHKHNIYQRLNISTHAELFRLFISYLTGDSPGASD